LLHGAAGRPALLPEKRYRGPSCLCARSLPGTGGGRVSRVRGAGPTTAVFVVSLLCASLLCADLSNATVLQDPPATVEPTLEQPSGAIPVPRIPSRATSDNEILQQIRSDLADGPQEKTAEIVSRLGAVVEAVRRLAQLPESVDPESRKRAALVRVRADWQANKRTLDGWEQLLTRRIDSLEAVGETLARMRREWQLTLDAQGTRETPQALADRTESILTAIDETDSDRQARWSALLTLQDRISREQSTANAALARMSDAEQRQRAGRFSLDSDPLWTALGLRTDEASLRAQVAADWRQRVRDFRGFVGHYPQRIAMHAGLFLVFLTVLLMLRASGRAQSPEYAGLKATRRVLSRPFASALLFALAATRLLYPTLPFVVVDVVVIAGLVPVLRLLPGLIGAGRRAPFYALGGLFVLDRLVGLADERTLTYRLALLGSTGLTLVLAVWLLRSGLLGRARGGAWRSVSLAFTRTATVAFAVSILANLAGALALSRLLTRGTLISCYAALVLFAAGLALEGLVVFALRSGLVKSLRLVAVYSVSATRWTMGFIRVVLFLAWLRITFVAFDAYAPVSLWLQAVLTRRWNLGPLDFSVGGVLAFVVALAVGLLASRLIPALLQEDVLSRTKMPLATRGTIALLVRYGILAFALLAAVSAAGLELGQITIIVGALGVGIGFGLQELVNNVVSGLILAFERPIRMGDTVQVVELIGHVARIGIRASVVRTLEGAEVIVPNGQLLSSQVINWTLSDRRRRLEVAVGVAYGTEPGHVLRLLEQVASEHPRVLEIPAPLPLFRGFGDSSLDFVLRCWVADFEEGGVQVRSEIGVAIHDALRRAEIEIPFPQRDLRVRSIDPLAGQSLMPTREEQL